MSALPEIAAGAPMHCRVEVSLAQSLPLRREVIQALADSYERWDGKGGPRGLAHDQIPLAARALRLATQIESHRRAGGLPSALEVARVRRGGELDPELCDLFIKDAKRLTAGFDARSLWDTFLNEEPAPIQLARKELERVACCFARFVDYKSSFTLGHSTGVAALASSAAEAAGLSAQRARQLRIAAYVHDIGRAGVPTGIWDKRGSLTRMERSRVETHSYLTETILAASPPLAELVEIAGSAHERVGGGGYHRRLRSLDLAPALLGGADMLHALCEERPWRSAHARREATRMLLEEAKSGRCSKAAVSPVLEAAGEKKPTSREVWPCGLTKREAEVLREVARGRTNKEIASILFISPKTVDHHIEHIYEKTEVRSRAAAALFAVENGFFEA
jgi:HD-GYP domain-containing protein (c-di-GMP phosphodiesterase class II)/DNA-binding CsgD family transcriptional regulator